MPQLCRILNLAYSSPCMTQTLWMQGQVETPLPLVSIGIQHLFLKGLKKVFAVRYLSITTIITSTIIHLLTKHVYDS